jgi:hypothetical protein
MQRSNAVYKTKMMAAILIMSFSLASRSKSDTPGPQGATGATGSTGNANVIASGIYSPSSSNWGYNSTSSQYYTNLIDSSITPAVISSGAVMVYLINLDGSNTALPYNNSSGYYTNYVLQTYMAQIQVGLSNSGTPDNPGSKQYRIVVIASALRKAYPNADWQNYYEVQKLINDKTGQTNGKIDLSSKVVLNGFFFEPVCGRFKEISCLIFPYFGTPLSLCLFAISVQ